MAQNSEGPREQWARTSDEHRTDFDRAPRPAGYRAGAWALWVVGLLLEFAGVLGATGDLGCPVLSALPALTVAAAAVLDAACVLAAQRLWKRGQVVAGVRGGRAALPPFMACLSFVPMVLFFLAAKNAGTKARGAAVCGALVAVAALLLLRLFI